MLGPGGKELARAARAFSFTQRPTRVDRRVPNATNARGARGTTVLSLTKFEIQTYGAARVGRGRPSGQEEERHREKTRHLALQFALTYNINYKYKDT